MRSFNLKTMIHIATLIFVLNLGGCSDDVPTPSSGFTRESIQQTIGQNHFTVPKNYIDSRSSGGMLVIATWPEMEGRTAKNFDHYQKSNIRILVSVGSQAGLESARRIYLLNERSDCWPLEGSSTDNVRTDRASAAECEANRVKPILQGTAYGFAHSVIRHQYKRPLPEAETHRDIYVRRDKAGQLEAVMRCGGEPAPPRRNPQCELWGVYPEFPGLEFKISFSRRMGLAQVNEIEKAVINKFLSFQTTKNK